MCCLSLLLHLYGCTILSALIGAYNFQSFAMRQTSVVLTWNIHALLLLWINKPHLISWHQPLQMTGEIQPVNHSHLLGIIHPHTRWFQPCALERKKGHFFKIVADFQPLTLHFEQGKTTQKQGWQGWLWPASCHIVTLLQGYALTIMDMG